MPVLTQLNLNIGTEQNPNMVIHDLHDIRISSTDVNTVTRLLGCDAGVNSIAPLTLANAASLLGGQQKEINNCNDATNGWNILAAGISDGNRPSGTDGVTIWLYHHTTNSQYDNAIQKGYVSSGGRNEEYRRVKQDGVWTSWVEV